MEGRLPQSHLRIKAQDRLTSLIVTLSRSPYRSCPMADEACRGTAEGEKIADPTASPRSCKSTVAEMKPPKYAKAAAFEGISVTCACPWNSAKQPTPPIATHFGRSTGDKRAIANA